MRIAVLLTGRILVDVAGRIRECFPGADFYGHTWSDDVSPIKLSDIIEEHVTKNTKEPMNASPELWKKHIKVNNNVHLVENYKFVKGMALTSYNELIDDYSNIQQHIPEGCSPYYISLMSQFLSLKYALSELKKSSKQYDIVVKWRWDLVGNTDMSEFLSAQLENFDGMMVPWHVKDECAKEALDRLNSLDNVSMNYMPERTGETWFALKWKDLHLLDTFYKSYSDVLLERIQYDKHSPDAEGYFALMLSRNNIKTAVAGHDQGIWCDIVRPYHPKDVDVLELKDVIHNAWFQGIIDLEKN
jgi:hypothetical protein